MKTNFLKLIFLAVITAATFASCVNDDDYSIPSSLGCEVDSIMKKTIEVSQVPATAAVTQYLKDDVIEAYVTSSDKGGNFYKTISFQTKDGSKAFSVPVDVTSTFINFEPGRKVYIKLNGLYTDLKDGGMRIGAIFLTNGAAQVGRMPEAQYKTTLVRSCTVISEDSLVSKVSIKDALNDSYINKLIEIENVQFADDAITTTYYDSESLNTIGGATNHNLIDLEGNSIIFRSSEFSAYGSKPVATGSGSVRGVLTKFQSTYQFVARTEDDIKLNETRFKPLLNETFSVASTFDTWATYSVTGAEVWVYSATFGNPGGMAKMSGFNGGNLANEDWLISPSQDLSTLSSAKLSFDNAYKFTGNPIEVLISNNYSGTGNPYADGVTWTTITGVALSAGNYVYVNSGNLNIDPFTGSGNNNVYIAFKYTSTTSAASTWEIDNVKITPNN